MDTGKIILIVALLGVIVLAAILASSGDPTGAALLQAQAGITTAPAAVSPLGGLASFAFKAIVILVCLTGIGAVGYFISQRIQRRQPGAWTPGPNANWGRSARMPKAPTLMDLLTLQAYKSILHDQQPPYAVPTDDRKEIRL